MRGIWHRPGIYLATALGLSLVLIVMGFSGPGLRAAPAAPAIGPVFGIVLDPPITTGGPNINIGLASAGDARLFVVQQPGRILIISDSAVLPAPFLDISAMVAVSGNEQGLLGLVFHPSYATNGFFYIDYTDLDDNLVLERYSRSVTDPNLADPGSGVILLTVPHPDANYHYGGQLAFGPDGYLYAGLGDGGPQGDALNHAQNRASLLGKLLRIDVDVPPPAPYAIPTTNPFYGQSGVRWEIWDWGLRNPWRFSFDSATHDLYIGDVGQYAWEEVNFEPAGSPGGVNYGWRLWEGRHCYNPATHCTPTPGATPFYPWATPVAEYDHTVPPCAGVIGGYVYRGRLSPSLDGVYLYSDYCTSRIWGLWQLAPGTWQMQQLITGTPFIAAFGQDSRGELWVVNSYSVQHIRENAGHTLLPVIIANAP